MLGLLPEDKQLTQKFFSNPRSTVESIRKQIESLTPREEKISASVDLPLSTSAKRVLSYAAEENDRLGHRHIGTEHLLLGILREEKSPACEILCERGLGLRQVREGIVAAPSNAAEVSNVIPPDIETQFSRLLDLLVRKGVIDDDDWQHIASE